MSTLESLSLMSEQAFFLSQKNVALIQSKAVHQRNLDKSIGGAIVSFALGILFRFSGDDLASKIAFTATFGSLSFWAVSNKQIQDIDRDKDREDIKMARKVQFFLKRAKALGQEKILQNWNKVCHTGYQIEKDKKKETVKKFFDDTIAGVFNSPHVGCNEAEEKEGISFQELTLRVRRISNNITTFLSLNLISESYKKALLDLKETCDKFYPTTFKLKEIDIQAYFPQQSAFLEPLLKAATTKKPCTVFYYVEGGSPHYIGFEAII